MQLQTAKCTVCGATLKLNIENEFVECKFCLNQIIVKQAFEFAKVEVDRSKDILKYRNNLVSFLSNNSIKEILRVSSNIKDILPEDYEANYYFGYAKQILGEPRFIYEFYEGRLNGTEEQKERIIEHIKDYSDLRDKRRILSYLEKIKYSKKEEYLQRYDTRSAQEENYSNIPRDVFVCFSSENQSVAEKVLNFLENDGKQCWISIRNLRPNDTENYWNSIEKAIDNCSVFLVISSEEAMRSKDVQKEVELASTKKKNMLEFKIDQSRHTQLFKHAFDGKQWVDGYNNLNKGYNKLVERIFNESKLIKSNQPRKSRKLIITLAFSLAIFLSAAFTYNPILRLLQSNNSSISSQIFDQSTSVLNPASSSNQSSSISSITTNSSINTGKAVFTSTTNLHVNSISFDKTFYEPGDTVTITINFKKDDVTDVLIWLDLDQGSSLFSRISRGIPSSEKILTLAIPRHMRKTNIRFNTIEFSGLSSTRTRLTSEDVLISRSFAGINPDTRVDINKPELLNLYYLGINNNNDLMYNVIAKDDLSGLNGLDFYVRNLSSNFTNYTIYLGSSNLNDSNSIYEPNSTLESQILYIPLNDLPNGEYEIGRVLLRDNNGNITTFTQEQGFSPIKFSVRK
jgi:hypothetical protein